MLESHKEQTRVLMFPFINLWVFMLFCLAVKGPWGILAQTGITYSFLLKPAGVDYLGVEVVTN